MFTKNNGVQAQAQFDVVIGERNVRKAGSLFFNATLEPVEANQAEVLVAFVPNCVFTARDGNLTVIPRDSDTVTGGSESERNTEWVRGGWLAAIRTNVLCQEVQHVVFGRVGNNRGIQGGFAISAPSMERGGRGTLEQLLTDTVQRVSAHFWAHRADFVGTDVGLEDLTGELSTLLGRPVRLDLDIKKEQVATPLWVNGEGEEVKHGSVRDQRRTAYQAKKETAGTTRVVASTATLEGIQARLNIAGGRIETDGGSGTGTGTRG